MPAPQFFVDELDAISTHSHVVDVDGVRTAWWNYGPTRGPISVVLIHGFRGDHHGLEPLVAKLGGKLRIVIPDLPGFGDSEPLASREGVQSRIDGFAAWLASFLKVIKANDHTVLVGHSFGSIVVAAAFHRGLRQHNCILINPIAANALSGPRGILTRLAVAYYRISAKLPETLGLSLLRNRAIVRVMSSTMSKTRDRDLRAWIHGQHDSYFSRFASRESVLHAFQASVEHDVSEFVETLPSGTLLIAADRDDITALPAQRALVAKIPRGRLDVVHNVGHLVHYEAPDFAAQSIRRFIAENG